MTAHPAHPPSEMVDEVRAILRNPRNLRDDADLLIRTMFAHVDRPAMARGACRLGCIAQGVDCNVCDCWEDELPQIDAALAAALNAALPGDA